MVSVSKILMDMKYNIKFYSVDDILYSICKSVVLVTDIPNK